jgi:predicted HicB family RNase H-like nuclease
MTMTIQYEGYAASVSLDADQDLLVGRVIGIRDTIVFHATSVEGLKKAFAESLEDYLEYCEEEGIAPAKPYSGNFSVRMEPSVHQRVEKAAAVQGLSMNEWIVRSITRALDEGTMAVDPYPPSAPRPLAVVETVRVIAPEAPDPRASTGLRGWGRRPASPAVSQPDPPFIGLEA